MDQDVAGAADARGGAEGEDAESAQGRERRERDGAVGAEAAAVKTSSTPASSARVPSLSKGASMPVRPWERFVSVPVLTRVPAPRTRS